MAVSTLLSAKWRDRSLDGYLREHVPTQETCVSIVRETNNVTRTLLIVLVQPVLFLH